MSEVSAAERLTALRFLARVQERDLARTQRWILDAERRAGEEQIRHERAKLPPPEWILQRSAGRGSPTLHTTIGAHADACWGANPHHARAGTLSRQQALNALTEGAEACPQCRPDVELGVL
ncbi:DUF6233 domain-containing protein [Streptomyces sp. NPDC050738]|uniref:DUF6233 domain-containing protein n=1 Tax=Streptomyces sp. NPDC050738 TaxID=3154744 RepID=UPI003441113C